MTERAFGAVALGAILAASSVQLRAQTSRMPDTYSYSARGEMVWPNTTHTVHRNGPKELVEIRNESGDFHLVQLYDFQAHRVYTRDLNAKTCTYQTYTSPYAPQNDPIGGWEELARAMAKDPPKFVRLETVNGIAARVVEAVFPGEGKLTYWLDRKFGFPVKQTATLGKGAERVVMEMRQLSYAPSPAALFAPPGECSRMGGESSATGGHGELSAEVGVSGTADFGKAPAAPAPPVRGNVTDVRLHLVPERYTGPCPSPLKLVADITADGPGKVWYEFLAGAVRLRCPGEGTVEFKAAGTQRVTLEADYVYTPEVTECLLLAAPVKENGSHGPQTVSSGPVSFNATCTGADQVRK